MLLINLWFLLTDSWIPQFKSRCCPLLCLLFNFSQIVWRIPRLQLITAISMVLINFPHSAEQIFWSRVVVKRVWISGPGFPLVLVELEQEGGEVGQHEGDWWDHPEEFNFNWLLAFEWQYFWGFEDPFYFGDLLLFSWSYNWSECCHVMSLLINSIKATFSRRLAPEWTAIREGN